jgi:hypothetical protein
VKIAPASAPVCTFHSELVGVPNRLAQPDRAGVVMTSAVPRHDDLNRLEPPLGKFDDFDLSGVRARPGITARQECYHIGDGRHPHRQIWVMDKHAP